MEELLIVVLQGLLELAMQLLCSVPLSAWSWRGEPDCPESRRGCLVLALLVLAGAGLGWLSLLVVPVCVLPWPWLRLANLVVAPVLSGLCSWWIANWRARAGAGGHPGAHALRSGLACTAFVLVRFLWGGR